MSYDQLSCFQAGNGTVFVLKIFGKHFISIKFLLWNCEKIDFKEKWNFFIIKAIGIISTD